MLKCDSCSKTFQRVGSLFEHIQSSCLNYYQSHPQAWAKILSKLGNENGEAGSQQKTNVRTTSPSRNRSAASRTVGASKPAAFSKSDTPGPSSSSASNKGIPFVCKCEAQFKKLETFKAHLKVCTPGKEPPFCIMFKAQEADGGKSLKNVHMTVNDYFYGTLPGKQVKMKKINRRCNCYSCGKNLRNNVRYMSHVRHKIIHEWEKKEAIDARNICQHCYRQYDSPFLLQCHLENVHGSVPAACTCRICELHFPSERSFLFHMKDKHVHNEVPYVCKVCNYRSSFYNDVIKHFRDEHGDTSALMCPFCLAVSFNSSSFLRHVLQHIKKGAECQRCRLIFTGMKEKATHIQTDHTTQLITEKLRKYKNLQKCQIYVRVASFQMTQRQHLMQKSPERFSKENGCVVSLKHGLDDIELIDDNESSSPRKKVLLAPCVELPAYLCPLKKTQKMKKVRVPQSRNFMRSTFRCVECGDSIQKDSSSIVQHFQSLHECRWCVFITSCEKASCSHVLKEHADAELREQLIGKSESDDTSFDAVLDDDDDVSLSNVKEEPKAPPSPMNVFVPNQVSEDSSEAEKSNDANRSPAAGSSTSSKPRRKQSNPMKISDTCFENSPSPKKVRREKKVQVRVLEAEKGTQACDLDFKPDDSDVEFVGTSNATSKKKSSDKPSSSTKKNSNSTSTTKTTTGTRHRKILAPEGYFPDIDDDEGWAKYFAEVEGATVPGSEKSTAATQMSPSVAPKTTATSIMPQNSATATSASKTIGGIGSMVVTNKGVTSSRNMGSGVSNLTSGSTNADKASVSWNPKSSLPTMVSTAGPVFRFQVVPGSNTVVPSGGFSPGAGVMRPLSQTSLVSKVQKMLSQVPQSPVDLRCLEFTHSSMLIQWDAPSNCIVTQYKVIFQGSGAPTVQLLPPEQTLVRLVGLKSDTMYVVRVYSLCNKAVSQYAFLYQRTNKMPRDNPRPGEDVVLVVDDEPSTSQPSTVKTTATPSTTSANIKSGSPAAKVATTTVTQALSSKAITSGVPLGAPVRVTVSSAASTFGLQPVLASGSAKEKPNKKLLIDELVSSLKKNKTEKANGTKLNLQGSSAQHQNPVSSAPDDANTPASSTAKVTKASGDEDASVVDGDAIYMVLDSPGRGDVNIRSDTVKTKSKDQTVKTVSKLRTILPKPSADDRVAWITNVAVVPAPLQLRTGSSSEMTDPGIQITSIKSNNSLLEDSGDKPDIIIEQNDSNEATETKPADAEVNIVNVVSLSKKPEEKEPSGNVVAPSNPDATDTICPEPSLSENNNDVDKLEAETHVKKEELESTETGEGNVSKEGASQSMPPEEITKENESPSADNPPDPQEHSPADESPSEDTKPDYQEHSSADESPSEDTKLDSQEHVPAVASLDKDALEQHPPESAKPKKAEQIDNVVIVLDDILKKSKQDRAVENGSNDQTEKDMICEISLKEPIQSSEISQSQDAIAPLLSLMPQPLKAPVSSEVSTSISKGTLDENTGVFQEETKIDAGDDPVTVFIDNAGDDTSDASGTDIDDALDNEIKILSHNSETAECGSGPTLDDIKDIMDSDLSWL